MEMVEVLLTVLVYLTSLKSLCTVGALHAPLKRNFRASSSYAGESIRQGRGIGQNSWIRPQQQSDLDLLYGKDPAAAVLAYVEKSSNTSCEHVSLKYTFSNDTYKQFQDQTRSVIRTANILNNLFQSSGVGTGGSIYNTDAQEFYNALAAVVVKSDSLIYGSYIGFDQFKFGVSGEQHRQYFCPRVYRDRSTGRTVTKDLGQSDDNPPLSNKNYLDTEWFKFQKDKYENENRQCGTSVDKWLTSARDGTWTPWMTLHCDGGSTWTITYSAPFFGCDQSNTIVFKGVVAVDIDLQNININQCAQEGMFANTHKCRNSTQCIPVAGEGFRRGSYRCQCQDGYYIASRNDSFYSGSIVEAEYVRSILGRVNYTDNSFQCLPCKRGCKSCKDLRPCFADSDLMLRGIPLGIQSFCMTISGVLGLVIVRLRATRVMKASMWLMLEIVLIGALLLYSTVIIQYFDPSTLTCLLIPWFREVGFAVVYGALILKVYKLLAEFQSRKAHRVHVRDKDLLKYLLGLVMVVIVYMSAWTAINMDHVTDERNLIDEGITREKLRYHICKSHWWDYVIEIAEVLFLCLGIYLCYCVRSAPSDYSEVKYISWAIGNETIMSALLYVIRHVLWLSIHPDYIFLMYFLRCQLTVTITLILILGPKLWYAHRPPEDDHFRNRAYSTSDVHDTILPESMKLHVGISSNGDVDVGEINLAEMDPEDIRAELKRLYTQLQIYKTKTMRKDNPHISKRRGGRKQTHRRFSLQAFHYKHRHHHDHDHEHELSKTPEESTNSAEGVAIEMEGRSRAEEEAPIRTPTVTFKPGHKSIG